MDDGSYIAQLLYRFQKNMPSKELLSSPTTKTSPTPLKQQQQQQQQQ